MRDNQEFTDLVDGFYSLLEQTPPELVEKKKNPTSWSLKEIVGHLVDSASNNHQRFVRLQLGNLKVFPAYDNEGWIAVQRYNEYEWSALLALWISYNRLLLHVTAGVNPSCLSHVWENEGEAHPLEWLIEDYFRHMRSHRAQFQERLEYWKRQSRMQVD